jgi:hypothetical protein
VVSYNSVLAHAIDRSSSIICGTGEEKYLFRSFLSRNKVFQLLDDYMNQYYEERDAALAEQKAADAAKLNVFQKVS